MSPHVFSSLIIKSKTCLQRVEYVKVPIRCQGKKGCRSQQNESAKRKTEQEVKIKTNIINILRFKKENDKKIN